MLVLNVAIGSKIRAAREKAGLTQAELSEKIPGTTPTSISNLERGTTRVTVARLIQIGEATETEDWNKLLPPVDQRYLVEVDNETLEAAQAAALSSIINGNSLDKDESKSK